ncbi:hypothetical protein [Pseudolysinimonas sp.]|uniref:hypothetical protein n=1 Tax=Pseudolysinimonas sp. TaxID=2680009 RepID=UPI003F821B9D
MAERRFELTTIVPVTPAAAIDRLADLASHHGLHPFLVSAEVEARGDDAAGPWEDWRVVERPALGPLRYTVRFPARMQRTSPTSLVGTVRVIRGCSLVTRTTATPAPGGAVLRESTVVTAPLPLVGYMTNGARTAHARTYALLPEELAAGR